MKPLNTFLASYLILSLAACTPQPSSEVTSSGGSNIAEAQSERYDGPKARIAVMDFEDKMSSTNYYRAEYGRGMSDMLATALFQTNRFILLEREKLDYVTQEQDMGQTGGRFNQETAADIGELEGAELLLTGAITGFDPNVAGGSGGLILGPLNDLIPGVSGSYKQAHVAMDLRVIDARTGRIVMATSVEGTAKGFGGNVAVADVGLAGGLGGFARTPMETAIRNMIEKAVEVMVSKTPESYYRDDV